MGNPQKVVVLSQCILNQYAVLNGWERADGAFPFVQELVARHIGMIQLPCPELLALGEGRPPLSYADYDGIPGFRKRCRQWLAPVVDQVKAYTGSATTYIGVIGIHESPNCSLTGQRGVLMEEYLQACARAGLTTRYLEVPTWYSAEKPGDFTKTVIDFIENEESE